MWKVSFFQQLIDKKGHNLFFWGVTVYNSFATEIGLKVICTFGFIMFHTACLQFLVDVWTLKSLE